MKVSGANQGFLDRGFRCVKEVGVALLIFFSFSFNIP